MVGAALLDGARCLVAQRGASMSSPLQWEFPGGKVSSGELPERALERELDEELGIKAEIGPWVGRGQSVVDGRRIVLDVFAVRRWDGAPTPREHAALRWVTARELFQLDFAAPDVPVLPRVAALLC